VEERKEKYSPHSGEKKGKHSKKCVQRRKFQRSVLTVQCVTRWSITIRGWPIPNTGGKKGAETPAAKEKKFGVFKKRKGVEEKLGDGLRWPA